MKSYNVLFEFAQKLLRKNNRAIADAKLIDKILKEFKRLSVFDIERLIKDLEKPLKQSLKMIYADYVNGGYKKFINLKPYTLKDIKPKLRQELDNATLNSLGYITTQGEAFMTKIADRFRTWSTIPNEELRGDDSNQALNKFKTYLDASKIEKPDDWQQFIIEDQTRKLLGNMNRIAADEAGAIGFYWRTRRDKRVVGNPAGLYKYGTKAHNDHYEREGNFYIIKGNWALKKGYIKKVADFGYADEIFDGQPSVPIGCRCWAEYVTDIEDIPVELLTVKGSNYLDE